MMKKVNALTLLLIVALVLLVACAADDSQPATPQAPDRDAASPPIRPSTEPAAKATNTATAVPAEPTPEDDEPGGRLYTVGYVNQQQHLLTLDPATGEEASSLFAVPEGGWLSEVAVSPDGQRLLLAYSPPPEQIVAQYGFTALYVMPADASALPELLIPQDDPSESFFNISWPLDDTIYFAHYAPFVDESGLVLYVSQVKRAHLPDLEVETLVQDAAWPRLSNDGARLAYVTESGELMLSAADGSSPELLLGPEQFAAVDAPVFSPDGSQLYFSAVDLEPAALSPFDRLMGVRVAEAHDVPSDWWRMPVDADRQRERLTNIDKIGLYGDFDDSGRYFFFAAADGIYVMGPEGQDLRQLSTSPTLPTLDWTP